MVKSSGITLFLSVIDDVLTTEEEEQCRSSGANPCLHGGRCASGENGVYICACAAGRKGARCQNGKSYMGRVRSLKCVDQRKNSTEADFSSVLLVCCRCE